TEEVKTEEVKEEETKTEEVKAEENKTEEAKTEEVKAEETKTEDKSKALLSSLTELTKSKHDASPSCESAKRSDNATEASESEDKEEAAEYIPKDKYDIPIKIAKDQKVNIEPEKPKVSEKIIAAAAAKILDITTEKKRQPEKENSEEQTHNAAEAEKEYVPRDKYDIPIKIAKDQKVNIEPEKPKVSEEIIAAAAAKIFDIAPIKKKQTEKEDSTEQSQDTAEAEKEYVPKDKYDIPIKIAKDQKVNIEPEKPKVSEEIIAAAAAKVFDIAPIKNEAEPQTSEANKEIFTVPAPKAEEIKTEPKEHENAEEANKEVFTVPAPKAEEIKTEPKNTEKETISGNLKKIKETPDKELAPDFTARTLEMILESIKHGSDRDMSALREDIRDYFSDGFIMKDMLRRELRVFMSDAELPAHVSQRAMDLLPMLGTAKKKTSNSSLLRTISELDEEEPAAEIKKPAAVKMPSIEEDLAYNVSDMLMNYLKTVGSSEMKTSMCAEMISKGLKYDEYSKLFDFGLLKSGRILFDKIIPAAKAVVFCKKYEYQKAIPKAKNILLFSFYYMICPDILKMEAFATLKQTGFINYQTADIYKK
ncbi:MAG: hypothetical protein MJ234_02770, partial [bacterium]|nr:hypothetical protein [bacterium]